MTPDPIEELSVPSSVELSHALKEREHFLKCTLELGNQLANAKESLDAKCAEVERLNDVIKTSKVLETFKSLEKCAKALDTANAQIEVLREALEPFQQCCATGNADCECPGCMVSKALSTTPSPLLERLRDAEKKGFVDGLKRAVEILSLRIATPKNEAFTAAIEEAKVFLGAEIERGGKPAYCVCTDTPPTNEPTGEVNGSI